MKRYIIKILFIMSLLMSINIYSNAADETASIGLESDSSSIEQNSTINIQVKIKNQTIPVSAFDAFLNYDENIFEKVGQADITTNINGDEIDTFTYYKETKKLIMTFNEPLENIDTIINIKMRVKSDAVFTEGENVEVYLNKASLYNVDTDTYLLEEVMSEKLMLKGINPTTDDLYLSTEKYKIGENDTQNYEEGDKYIYRISPKTTITEFLANLSTNGNIRVYNADGEEETNYDEFIGTGMKLQVTKDDKVIELTISVIGDINCDGDADITDLIAIRRHIQKLQEITRKEIVLSADINEDTSIDITDLVKIRKYIQQIEKL